MTKIEGVTPIDVPERSKVCPQSTKVSTDERTNVTPTDERTGRRRLPGIANEAYSLNDMRYSWTRFGVGVGVGLVAVALLFVAISYFYISAILLFISNYFIAQPTKAPDVQAATVVSDLDAWRQFARDLVGGLRDAIVPLFVLLSTMFLWDIAVRRYLFLADVPKEYGELLAVMFLAAVWLMHMVTAFRNGRRRRLSSSS